MRLLFGETLDADPDVIQQRGAIDLLFHRIDRRRFQGERGGPESIRSTARRPTREKPFAVLMSPSE